VSINQKSLNQSTYLYDIFSMIPVQFLQSNANVY